MANKTISQYTRDSEPNILTEFLSMFAGVTKKVVLNDIQRWAIKTETTDFTLTEIDGVVLVDSSGGNVTVTLPVPTDLMKGKPFIIKKIDSSANLVTIDANTSGGTTLDSENTQDILNQNDTITFTTDGASGKYYAY